jgi:hypothetical protein
MMGAMIFITGMTFLRETGFEGVAFNDGNIL